MFSPFRLLPLAGRALSEFGLDERSTTTAPEAASAQPSNGTTLALAMLSVAATLMVLTKGRQNGALLETLLRLGVTYSVDRVRMFFQHA